MGFGVTERYCPDKEHLTLTGRRIHMKKSDTQKKINTVSEYVSILETIKSQQEKIGNKADLLFRGQSCDKPLLPKLGRLKTKGPVAKIEQLIFDEFKRTSLPVREFQPENDWDCLALAQHHGLPTRLLDWTYNALAALWFTVKSPPEKRAGGTKSEAGVVWVLCALTEDFRQDTIDQSPLDNSSRTLVFRPKAVTRRIVAQSGVFTVHKLINEERFIPLEKNKLYKEKLIKLRIPPTAFPIMRKELHRLGANAALLQPDLDGLCSHLQWRYTSLADEV